MYQRAIDESGEGEDDDGLEEGDTSTKWHKQNAFFAELYDEIIEKLDLYEYSDDEEDEKPDDNSKLVLKGRQTAVKSVYWPQVIDSGLGQRADSCFSNVLFTFHVIRRLMIVSFTVVFTRTFLL